MGNMSGSYGSHYTVWQSITQNWQSVEGNYTNVTVRMYLTFDGSSYYAYTNYTTYGNMGGLGDYSISSLNYSSGQYKDILLAEWTGNVYHEADGSKYFSVTGYWDTNTSRIGSGSCSAGVWLNQIQRYANLTSLSVQSRTVNTITLSYTTDRAARIYINLNNGQSWLNNGNPFVSNTTSGTITIKYKDRASTQKLDPNTTYNITVLCRNNDVDLDTSKNISATTYDIAKISNLPDFKHGNDASVTITNPASISSLSLAMEIGNMQILSRAVKTGTNTITFSDTELDNLYKKYGSSSSLTATFTLTGSGYTNLKTCTVTLKGNQKTIKINIDSNWKRAKTWVNVNEEWKRAIIWTNVNGTWKKSI